MQAIVAISENGAIGKDGGLPWPKIKEDLRWFREFTMGQSLVMGRKTFEPFRKTGLPGRFLCVLSNNWEYRGGIYKEDNGKFSVIGATIHGETHVKECSKGILCGGAQMYKQFLPLCDELFVTHVKGVFEADTFFTYSQTEIRNLFPYAYYV